jgi:hypothetical protein
MLKFENDTETAKRNYTQVIEDFLLLVESLKIEDIRIQNIKEKQITIDNIAKKQKELKERIDILYNTYTLELEKIRDNG